VTEDQPARPGPAAAHDTSGPAGGAPSRGPWVGRPLRRTEDDRLLRGQGRYVGNLARPGLTHMVVARSPLAHALIRSIDTSRARRAPGVVAILTPAELDDEGVSAGLPITVLEGAQVPDVPMPLLASGVARFAGEPVAAVVAESRAEAEDARDLLEVDYEPLPVVVRVDQAATGSPCLHPNAPGNVLLRWQLAQGDVAAAFNTPPHVVRAHLEVPRLAAAPIEPRGCLAEHQSRSGLLTLWCSAQDPHRPRSHLAAVLGLDPSSIRVVVPDVGGAFGSKGTLAPEHALAAICARSLQRPVSWVEDRSESFLASYQGRGLVADAALAIDGSGRFLALQARLVWDLGAYLYPTTPVVPITSARLLVGCYDIAVAGVEVVGLATNKVPTGPYRGAGRPEAAYVVERLADLAAARLGMDPVEIRKRNLIRPEQFPYRTALGFTYDSGDYEGALDRACELVGYRQWRRRQGRHPKEPPANPAPAALGAGPPHGATLTGIGITLFVERAGAGLWEGASVEITTDGHALVRTGSSSHGQGHETTFAQVAADRLGLCPDQVRVHQGDSAAGPPGVGTYGSRSTTIGGSAVAVAAEAVLAKARAVASHHLEVAPEDLRYEAGRFWVAGTPAHQLTLAEVARAAADPAALPPGMAPGLEATERFSLPGPVFPFGAHAAVVEVDLDTGSVRLVQLVAVDDAGTVVNPLLAEGQVVGSSIQGMAAAMLEAVVHDDQGQLLTASFADYGVPGAPEAGFPVQSELRHTPSPFNPLGAKGLGESGTIGVPAALANAVADALGPLGVEHLDPPYAPARVWAALTGVARKGRGPAGTGARVAEGRDQQPAVAEGSSGSG
jgi:carbon-monoxide dehydrogenase large subunit